MNKPRLQKRAWKHALSSKQTNASISMLTQNGETENDTHGQTLTHVPLFGRSRFRFFLEASSTDRYGVSALSQRQTNRDGAGAIAAPLNPKSCKRPLTHRRKSSSASCCRRCSSSRSGSFVVGDFLNEQRITHLFRLSHVCKYIII